MSHFAEESTAYSLQPQARIPPDNALAAPFGIASSSVFDHLKALERPEGPTLTPVPSCAAEKALLRYLRHGRLMQISAGLVFTRANHEVSTWQPPRSHRGAP